jgi:hypothetical protein
LVVSVLPAPLSPLTNIDWLPCSLIIALKIIVSNKTMMNIRHNTIQMSKEDDTHTPVTRICNREEMGAELPKGGAFVLLHHVHIVKMWQPLEGIDCNQDVPGVRLPDHLPMSDRQLTKTVLFLTGGASKMDSPGLLTYISLSPYRQARLCKTPGSCR